MANENLSAVYAANPITAIGNNDLSYVGQNGTTDAAILGSNLIRQLNYVDATPSYVPVTNNYLFSIGNNTSTAIVTGSGTLATGTIVFPTAPLPGQIVKVAAGGVSTTSLTIQLSGGQSIVNAPTTLPAGLGFAYEWSNTASTWYPLYNDTVSNGNIVGTLYTSSGRVDTSKIIYTPSTGATVNLQSVNFRNILNPAGTLGTLTLVLPGAPFDGQNLRISTSQQIVSLTVNGAGRNTAGMPTTLAASSAFEVIWDNPTITWYIA